LAFLHAFQKRGLGFWRSSIDLVADHDVGEHRTGPELELPGAAIEHRHSGDVARE
jgi:hypothetical protein